MRLDTDAMAWSLRGQHISDRRHWCRGQQAPGSESNCLAFAREWGAGIFEVKERGPVPAQLVVKFNVATGQ